MRQAAGSSGGDLLDVESRCEKTKVEILYSPGCKTAPATAAMVRDLLDELGIDAVVETRVVSSDEEAKELRYLGSPSVRVNGADVEPGAEGRGGFGLG